MTKEDRKQLAKEVYEDLRRQGHSLEVAREILKERHGLSTEALNEITPVPKAKPLPKLSKAQLETELMACAGMLRSLAAALKSPNKDPKNFIHLARNADARAFKIEKIFHPDKKALTWQNIQV